MCIRDSKDTMVVTVNKIYEGTPSESAGLLKDDVIVSVDGTEAASMELSELVKLIRDVYKRQLLQRQVF